MDKATRAKYVDTQLFELGLTRPTSYKLPPLRKAAWRVAPEPYPLTQEQKEGLREIGPLLYRFYVAADKLYHLGLTEKRYSFVAEYLDQGKPAGIIDISRHPRFKGALPLIFRPDLLWTQDGFKATEFDSIPGGAGLLSGMERLYKALDYNLTDTSKAFYQAIRHVHNKGLLAIVVSLESAGYRDEMAYLANLLREKGMAAVCITPEEIDVRYDGAFYKDQRIGTIYRFFELFDIDNIPQGWEMLRLAQNGQVRMTPPPKAYLEEKLWFALIHHPILTEYWIKDMGEKGFRALKSLIPETYVLDPRPLPPHAVIPGLMPNGRPTNSYEELLDLPKGARGYVIKPSGFSPESWGSHGVVLGRDLTTRAWADEIKVALNSFYHQPHILQRFSYSLVEEQEYYDFRSNDLQHFNGKSRFCPYFFNGGKNLILEGGILVTTCPVEKPLIHGMTDAVMAPARD